MKNQRIERYNIGNRMPGESWIISMPEGAEILTIVRQNTNLSQSGGMPYMYALIPVLDDYTIPIKYEDRQFIVVDAPSPEIKLFPTVASIVYVGVIKYRPNYDLLHFVFEVKMENEKQSKIHNNYIENE